MVVSLDRVVSLCVCPACRQRLAVESGRIFCSACSAQYAVRDGIPVLIAAESAEQGRYRASYERLARDDLESPVVANRFELMHRVMIDFIGDVRGRRILDIGSAYGSYLRELQAGDRVAVDIALPYLEAIPADDGIARVCGDAEALPIDLRAFDVVLISDVLEHLLRPERLVALLLQEMRDDARLVIHIPWRESLSQYDDSPYEFTHLRSFDEYGFRHLFWGFDVLRERPTLPRLSEPVVFRLNARLPRFAYNALVGTYFRTPLAQIEYRYRARWIDELPRRERWLLRLYEPQVKLFELRKRTARPPKTLTRLLSGWLSRIDSRRPAEPEPAPHQAHSEILR